MHKTIDEFNKASESMKKMVEETFGVAYQLGCPDRFGLAIFAASEYECDHTEQRVLVEVNYVSFRVMGRTRTTYSYSPVLTDEGGWPSMKERLLLMFEGCGHPIKSIDIVCCELDRWAVLVSFPR
jgi:hypothetical protein